MNIIALAVSIISLLPLVTGIAILLLAESHPSYVRSTVALGTMFLLSALALAILGTGSALIDGRQPFIPYLVVTGLPAIAVARMMQTELRRTGTLPEGKS